jgi:hypothetical protein
MREGATGEMVVSDWRWFRSKAGKTALCLTGEVSSEGECGVLDCMIWLTEAARDLSGAQLRHLGFDPAVMSLADIGCDWNPCGKKFNVKIQIHNGRLGCKMMVTSGAIISEDEFTQLDQMIRGSDGKEI